MCVLSHFSQFQFFVTLWTVVRQVLLPMGFSRQEYWSGLPSPPPGGLPNPEMESASPVSPALAGRFFTTSPLSPLLTQSAPPADTGPHTVCSLGPPGLCMCCSLRLECLPCLSQSTNTRLFFSTKPERHFLREAFSDAAGWSGISSKGSP